MKMPRHPCGTFPLGRWINTSAPAPSHITPSVSPSWKILPRVFGEFSPRRRRHLCYSVELFFFRPEASHSQSAAQADVWPLEALTSLCTAGWGRWGAGGRGQRHITSHFLTPIQACSSVCSAVRLWDSCLSDWMLEEEAELRVINVTESLSRASPAVSLIPAVRWRRLEPHVPRAPPALLLFFLCWQTQPELSCGKIKSVVNFTAAASVQNPADG